MRKVILIITTVVIIAFGGVFFYINNNSEISLKEDTYILNVGEEKEIEFSLKKDYTYVSEDSNIVSVDKNGVLSAKHEGKTKVKIKNRWKTKTCKVTVLPIVESINFEKENYSIMKGEELVISYTVNPKKSKVESESWSSSDEKIVTVEKGKIKAISYGTSTISLIVNDKVKRSVIVTVYPEAEEIVLNASEINLSVGESFIANAEIKPIDVDDKNLIWTSSDESIAKVTDGKIEALKPGVVTISVESSNKVTAHLKVNVNDNNVNENNANNTTINTNTNNTKTSNTNTNNSNANNTKESKINVYNISLNKTSAIIYVDNSIKLIAAVNPSNASDKSVTWTSSNSSVATVKDGNVVAKTAGETIISAKTSNGKTATCKIKVVNKTYGKTAIFFGDSITEGCYLDRANECTSSNRNKTWVDLIEENDFYNIKTINAGRHGWLISRAWGTPWWIKKYVEKYNGRKFDYVILSGGINDINYPVAKGDYNTFSPSLNFDSDVYFRTLAGGLEAYIYTVKKQFPGAKIGYIITYDTPLYEKNGVSYSDEHYEEYFTLMKEILDKEGIKYIDLYSGTTSKGIKYRDLLEVYNKKNFYVFTTTDGTKVDGVHLNAEGYNIITPYIYEWMNTL